MPFANVHADAMEAEPVFDGIPLSGWVQQLDHTGLSNFGFRPPKDAANAISSIGTRAVPFLLTWIKDTNEVNTGISLSTPQEKRISIPSKLYIGYAFRILGEKAASAIPELEKLASTEPTDGMKSYEAFLNASRALPWLGSNAAPAMVRAANQIRDPLNRSSIIENIGSMGESGYEAIPFLLSCLQSDDLRVRRSAAVSLGQIRKRAEDVVPCLIAALKDTDFMVRIFAADSLGCYESLSSPGVRTLVEMFDDQDWNVRKSAILATGKIATDPEIVVPALQKQLKDELYPIRIAATRALGAFNGKEVIDTLHSAENDQNPLVRAEAEKSLGRVKARAGN